MKNPFQIIENIFLWSSGAHVETIRKVPEEKSKYFGIGGTIIFTGLMAMLAGGYAFSYAFPEKGAYAVFFALFWGALIFNLDRYIVATFGVGDGKKTISRQEWLEASPRLIMAIILGFVISTPLELKLFEKEINSRISDFNSKMIVKHDSIIQTDFKTKTKHIDEEINTLNNEINKRNEELGEMYNIKQIAHKDMIDEIQGTGGSGFRGEGPIYRRKKRFYEDKKTEYNNLNTKYTHLNEEARNRIKTLRQRKDEIQNEIKKGEIAYNKRKEISYGLMAQLKALDSLTKENSFLFGAKWLITLLFIFIEIAPVMFKMMTERGPYDDLMDEIKYEYQVKELLKKSKINSEINTELKLINDKNDQKLAAELAANEKLLKEIAQAQSEIASVAIENWKKEQLKAVKKDPSIIISSSKQ